MENLREWIGNAMEDVAKNLAQNSACALFWGEVEMPACMREDVEAASEQ